MPWETFYLAIITEPSLGVLEVAAHSNMPYANCDVEVLGMNLHVHVGGTFWRASQ